MVALASVRGALSLGCVDRWSDDARAETRVDGIQGGSHPCATFSGVEQLELGSGLAFEIRHRNAEQPDRHTDLRLVPQGDGSFTNAPRIIGGDGQGAAAGENGVAR